MDNFKEDFLEAKEVLEKFIANDENFDALHNAGLLMVEAIRRGNKLISCGNGGSMCDAMHFAEELSGRFREERPALPALSISDPSHITCVANDYDYNLVFRDILKPWEMKETYYLPSAQAEKVRMFVLLHLLPEREA